MKKKIIKSFLYILILLFLIAPHHQGLRIHSDEQLMKSHPNDESPTSLNKFSHKYYNLEQTARVSQSNSIKYLNMCKDLCLSMHDAFPFEFKYHRIVYRQQIGDLKYITGECSYTFKSNNLKNSQNPSNSSLNNQTKKQQKKWKKWKKWTQLKQFLDLSIVDDEELQQQINIWVSYYKDCQDDSIKLSDSSMNEMKFNIVHSDFQYYQQDGFQNLHPFDDLNTLLSNLTSSA